VIPEFDSRILEIFDQMAALGKPLLTSSGEPFEWREHVFMIEPLCDFHPSQGWNKGAQIGLSETTILKALYAAKVLKLNVLYTLPTDEFLIDFVRPKVNKIVDNNPDLFSDVVGGLYQKQVGTGIDSRFIYFQGAFNRESKSNREQSSQGVSITSDVNIHDEASKSDQFILTQMMSRYQNSRYKGRWLFDNPTYPKVGADAIWQISDQRHWIIKCEHCNYRQYLDWFRLDKHEFQSGTSHSWIDPVKKIFICGKCRRELGDQSRIDGQWIAKYPSKTDHRGYWANQLMYVRHTVKSIMATEEHPKVSTSYFQNMVLGKPYIGSDVKISRSHIAQNISIDVNPLIGNVMGIDQGKVKHYVIGNEKGIFAKGKTDSWDELQFLWRKYDAFVISDALPSQYEPKKFAQEMEGRFYRAFYKPESDQAEIAKFIPAEDGDHRVLIRRHEAFDEVVDRIVTGRFPMQLNINDLDEFIEHWEAMVRLVHEDAQGNQRFEWTHTDADHYAHASLYFYVGLGRAYTGDTYTSDKPRQKPKESTHRVSSIDMAGGGSLPPDAVRRLIKGRR
jgi:hypothetical protein